MKNIYINNAGDKAISIGEKSDMNVDGLVIKNSAIGIASNSPQNPQIPPKINTAIMINTG